MNGMIENLIDLPLPLLVALKMTLLLAAAGLSHILLRHNPRWRVLMWRGALVGLIILPAGELLLPKIQLPVSEPPQEVPNQRIERTIVTGRVLGPDGDPAPGIRVATFGDTEQPGRDWSPLQFRILTPDDWRRYATLTTDEGGRYTFLAEPGRKWEVHVGGVKSTSAVSDRFMAEPGGRYRVEDLTLRLASSSMQGVVLDAEGEPLAGAPFGARSAELRITPLEYRLERYPRTGPGGEFNLPHMLPDERLSFWVVLSENTAHIWQGLEPGGADIRLSLADGMRVDLPPIWGGMQQGMEGLDARVLVLTRVEEDVVNFELPDLEGNMVSLDDPRFANKVLLVNIWGTWCGHCRKEIPQLIELKKKYGARGLEIIGIAFEEGEPAERRRAVERFADRLQMNYPILLGGIHGKGSVESVLVGLQDFHGFPTTLFIGKGGTVDYVEVGFVSGTPERLAWQLRRTEERIERLLR